MKLYGSIVSPYVARVAYAARLKGLPLKPEMPAGGIKTPEFLKINPMGKMPALEVDGRGLAESMVLLDYLEDAHPTPSLLPSAAVDRAQARLLGRIVDLYVMPHGRAFFGNMNPEKRKADEVAAGADAYRKSLEQLEHFMGAGPYAIGDKLGYADVSLLPCLQMMALIAGACGIADPYAGLPRLTRWWSQMQSDPIAAEFVSEYQRAFTAFMASRS
jgi:glutathione S-transferase